MRIAIAGIAHESCTFSPLPTRLEDFRLIRPGAPEFGELYPFLPRFPDAQFFGALTAKAIPGGPIEASAYHALKDEIRGRLEALVPLDGVYLDMHGAMYVNGLEDAEGDLLAAIRNIVGPDCLISASYDLHGNVSERVMSNLDLITGYRTAPHVDVLETRHRAVALLVHCLRERIRPRKAFVSIPVALPGEKTSTEWEPGRRIYASIPEEIDGERVLDASIQVGYVWADEPRMAACAIAIGVDEGAIAEAAIRLARRYWRNRAEFGFGVPALSVDACIRRAMEADVQPVFISDSGDNPTAGGAGDVTYVLRRTLELRAPDLVYASIPDAQAVERCIAAGPGAEVSLEIGGKMDRVNSSPLAITGTVETISTHDDNAQVVLKSGGIRIILTSKRTPFHHRRQFLKLNIKPEDHRIVVVKIGYLVPELKAMARAACLALSPGAVNQDIASLPYRRIRRPCYPFDLDMDWTPLAQLF